MPLLNPEGLFMEHPPGLVWLLSANLISNQDLVTEVSLGTNQASGRGSPGVWACDNSLCISARQPMGTSLNLCLLGSGTDLNIWSHLSFMFLMKGTDTIERSHFLKCTVERNPALWQANTCWPRLESVMQMCSWWYLSSPSQCPIALCCYTPQHMAKYKLVTQHHWESLHIEHCRYALKKHVGYN